MARYGRARMTSEIRETKGRSRRRWASRFSGTAYILVAIALVFGLWAIAVPLFSIPRYLLPPPGEVFERLWMDRKVLLEHSIATGVEAILAFLVSAVVGALLGIVIAFSRPLARLLYPLLVGSNALPKLALAPLFIVWLGFGLSSKILIGFSVAFFPVVISTVTGLRAVDPDMIELARSMGSTRWRIFTKIRMPYALPSYFGGLKVAITLAVVGAVVGEFVGADRGLGYLVIVTSSQLDSVFLYATLIALTILAVGLYLIVEAAEPLVTPGPDR